MPLGTILLHSPGCNEGKARNETLGKQGTQKLRAPSGAALTEQVLALCCDCAAPLGLNKYAGVSPLQGSSMFSPPINILYYFDTVTLIK